MLDSQKIPSVRNEDFGRNRPVAFVSNAYTLQEAAMLEALHCDIERMTFPQGSPVKATESWAIMAKKEGHKCKLPSAPSPGGAIGGKISKPNTKEENIAMVMQAARKIGGIFYSGDLKGKVKLSHSKISYYLKKASDDGMLERLEKTGRGWEYRVK